MDAIGEQLAGSLEINATLQHVAEMLVPHFADHCFIDLFEGDALICRVRLHAGGWTPPPGTWKQVGEQIVYPEGHFCQQAMARLNTVIVADLAQDEGRTTRRPAPTPMRPPERWGDIGSRAPLYAGGMLLGVMSLALSNLTDRTERHYATADRYLIGAIASQVAIAIDKGDEASRGRAPERPRPLINRTRDILVIAAGGTKPGVPTSIHSLRQMRRGRKIQSIFGGTTEIMKEIIACDLTGLRT